MQERAITAILVATLERHHRVRIVPVHAPHVCLFVHGFRSAVKWPELIAVALRIPSLSSSELIKRHAKCGFLEPQNGRVQRRSTALAAQIGEELLHCDALIWM